MRRHDVSFRPFFIARPLERVGARLARLGLLLLAGLALAALPASHPRAQGAPAQAALDHASPHAAFASGQILVGMKADGDEAAFETALGRHGARTKGRMGATRVHLVEVASGAEEATVASLRADPDVEFAEVDRVIKATAISNDPLVGNEWHLTTIGAPTAWAYSTGAGITIAILDTGVEGTHPDLAAKMVPGWNFYNNTSNTSDSNGHGTTVAGAAAAATNNSIGVASVASGAKIMPIVVASPSAYATWSAVVSGVNYAADHGARVVSLSYEGASASSAIIQSANYLRSKGGVMFVSAGNTGAVDNTAPTDSMMVVAATLQNDTRASWSTYGSFVDISAPGYNIVTTGPGGAYWYCWGTSLATPIVAATAALVLAKRPDLTASQVDSILKSSATDLGTYGPDPYYGAGRVNAAAAVQKAIATPSGADTTKPTVSIASPVAGTVSGTVTVSINASDNVGVTRVELRVNGVLVGSDTASPWQIAWNTAQTANGYASLVATAYDAAGNSASSLAATVNVSNATATDTTAPTVAIASPTGGTVSGSVAVSVNASDNVGVTRVDLLVNNVLVGTTNVAPYKFTWASTANANGSATLTARAYDAAGNNRLSSGVVVTVSNTTGGTSSSSDTTAPVVTIVSPTNGSTVNSTISIKASATDNAGTAGITMQLYIDGAFKGSTSGASLSVNWNARHISNGTHTIKVTATDAAGNVGSSQVSVTH